MPTLTELPRSLPALIDHIADVCPMPAAAQRVMALTSDPNVDVRDITEALACDPAMAAQVLRIANSPAYARPRRVTELHQGVMTLGLGEVRNIGAAMALLAAFGTTEELSHELHALGALSGAIGRMIATEFVPALSGITLVCGLLSEVGALACLAVDGRAYSALWRRAMEHEKTRGAESAPRSATAFGRREELEFERYGATSREIGARLLRRNALPEDIAAAIEAPAMSGGEPSLLGGITMFSRRAAPMLVALLDSNETSRLGELLADLALTTGLGELDRERLRRLCVDAAVQTELALRKM